MSQPLRIPFNRPALVGHELDYIADAIRRGHASGDGTYTNRCHELLGRLFDVPKVLLTTSCTDALEMAALLLEIVPGDEVIVPSFTFPSTANAFVLRGARPIFVDIRPDTLNLDERRLPDAVTPKTRAIVVMHYAGVGCEMDSISSIASERKIPVVEDNAQGLFGKYRGKPLGTFGCLAAHSFHETKNVSCGEGGALFVNDLRYADRAEIVREKGTDRSRFFRGEVDKYTWVDLGSSYLPSDILAAFLCAQLEAWEQIQATRRTVWERYCARLSAWSQSNGYSLPFVPSHCEQSYHMFYLLLPSLSIREAFIAHLRSRGILAVFHYLPLHLSRMGRHFGGKPGDCPITEDVSDRLVRLPFFNDLSPEAQDYVIQAILDFAG